MVGRLPITLAQSKAGNTYKWNQATIIFFVPFKKINQINLQPVNQRYLKMETIFMNTENCKTIEPHRFGLSLTDKLNPKSPNKNIELSNSSIYYTWKNIKSTYSNNKFKIAAPTWNDTFELPDGSYSIVDIQRYF